MRHFLQSVKAADIVERINGRRQATMETKDLVLDHGREREVVKDVCKVAPDIWAAILAQSLVVKAVDLRNLPALVVAPENENAVLVPHFQTHEQRHGLHGIVASIDIVPHK